MSHPKLIYTVDALAGSGKTYQAIRGAILKAAMDRQKTAIVFKSKKLVEQAYADALAFKQLKRLDIPVRAIYSNLPNLRNHTDSVTELLQCHLSSIDPNEGEILMITEAALLRHPHWPNRYQWTLICDEIPDIAPSIKKNLPEHHGLITQHLTLIPHDSKYSEIGFVPGGRQAIVDIAENRSDDDVNRELSEMAARLVSPIYQNFVLTQQYRQLVDPADRASGQLEVFSLLQPSLFGLGQSRSFEAANGKTSEADMGFKEVIIMGAGFEKSLMHRIWPGLDVQFEPYEPIRQKLRYSQHECGPRLQIQYVFDSDWSKYFADQTSLLNGVEISNFEVLIQACSQVFGEDPFVYLINKDREHLFETQYADQGQQLNNSPWGLNNYQTYHNAAILSALNPTSAHLGFLQSFLNSSDEVRDALFHSQVYQAIMRTSLRNFEATNPVQVLLPDRKSAAALAEYFPGCTWSKLCWQLEETKPKQLGRPKLQSKKTRAEINKAANNRRKAIASEIRRIERGGAVDVERFEQLKRQCKRTNAQFARLQKLVADAHQTDCAAAG